MTTKQVSKSSGTGEPRATDHREIEWQFDADELGPVEGWLGRHSSGSSGLAVVPDSLRAAVPDSKPFRALKKAKRWKKFGKVLEDQKASNVRDAGVR